MQLHIHLNINIIFSSLWSFHSSPILWRIIRFPQPLSFYFYIFWTVPIATVNNKIDKNIIGELQSRWLPILSRFPRRCCAASVCGSGPESAYTGISRSWFGRCGPAAYQSRPCNGLGWGQLHRTTLGSQAFAFRVWTAPWWWAIGTWNGS